MPKVNFEIINGKVVLLPEQLELFPINLQDTVSIEREAKLVQERDYKISEAWTDYENETELQGTSEYIYWFHISSIDYIEQYCPKYFKLLGWE
jgi:hypothetical protein